jgi:hypothetical protein
MSLQNIADRKLYNRRETPVKIVDKQDAYSLRNHFRFLHSHIFDNTSLSFLHKLFLFEHFLDRFTCTGISLRILSPNKACSHTSHHTFERWIFAFSKYLREHLRSDNFTGFDQISVLFLYNLSVKTRCPLTSPSVYKEFLLFVVITSFAIVSVEFVWRMVFLS